VELLEAGPVVFPAYEQTTVAVRSLVEHLDDETRAVLAHELNDLSTSTAAVELATDDGPDEPPVASRNNQTTIRSLLAEAGLDFLNKETSDVPQ
jgi:hypothetical protein